MNSGQTGGGSINSEQTGVRLPPAVTKPQIPSDITCGSKEQYDLKSRTCEEVGVAGADVFKIIVKRGEVTANNPNKVQVWVSGNDVIKVRVLSQPLFSEPSGVLFEFPQDVIKVDDPFTVCYRPLTAEKDVAEASVPICVDGSNSPDKKPEIVTLTAK